MEGRFAIARLNPKPLRGSLIALGYGFINALGDRVPPSHAPPITIHDSRGDKLLSLNVLRGGEGIRLG